MALKDGVEDELLQKQSYAMALLLFLPLLGFSRMHKLAVDIDALHPCLD